jgi:hypothetical protein
MMFFLLIWSLSTLGFVGLACSMSKHQKQIAAKVWSKSETNLAKYIGWLFIVLALVVCILNGTLSNMISYWVGTLSFAALTVALTLTYIETKVKYLVATALVVTVVSSLVLLFA